METWDFPAKTFPACYKQIDHSHWWTRCSRSSRPSHGSSWFPSFIKILSQSLGSRAFWLHKLHPHLLWPKDLTIFFPWGLEITWCWWSTTLATSSAPWATGLWKRTCSNDMDDTSHHQPMLRGLAKVCFLGKCPITKYLELKKTNMGGPLSCFSLCCGANSWRLFLNDRFLGWSSKTTRIFLYTKHEEF